MARASHEPQIGSDHPPQNGNKGKHVAIALFIATTFGIMAILSFPLSRVVRLPIRLPHPLEAALNPIERLIRPVIPSFGRPSEPRPHKVSVALGPRGPRGTAPSGPSGTAGPGSAPPPAPPGEGVLPTAARIGPQTARTVAALVKQLTTILSNRTVTLSPEQARLIRAEISKLRSMREACLADRACARQLKLVEKLLHKLEAHQRGRHQGKHHHQTRHKLEGNGQETPGHSHKRHGTKGKHQKHHKG